MTQTVLLGDLIEIKHGYAFKGEYFSDTPTTNILVTPGNFEIGGGFKQGKLKYYNGPIDDHFILAPNSVVITMTDLSKAADTLGFSARVPNNRSKTYLHNQRIGLVTLKSDIASLDYIYWLMRSSSYRKWVIAGATGSTVKHTAPSKILSYKFELPGLDKQKKIADILGTIDEKIELNRKMNETLEEMGQTFFRHYFIDNPEAGNWGEVYLKEFGKIITGKTPPTKQTELYDGKHLFLKIPDMTQLYPLTTLLTLSDAGYEKQRPYLLPKDSLNISCIGTVGLMTINKIPLSTNQNINSIIPTKPHSLYYLYFALKPTIKKRLSNLGAGSVFSTVSKSKFEKISLKHPGERELQAFHETISPVMDQIYLNTQQIQALTTHRDTLLPRLISGKVRL